MTGSVSRSIENGKSNLMPTFGLTIHTPNHVPQHHVVHFPTLDLVFGLHIDVFLKYGEIERNHMETNIIL